MSAQTGSTHPVLSAASGLEYPLDPVGPVGADAIPARQLEEIVDKVVEKIEQRVINELERRGRRHTPGVF